MAKSSGLKNGPSGTGNPSGPKRGNNPPSKPNVTKGNTIKPNKK